MTWKVSDRQIHRENGAVIATVWWYGNKGCISKQEARETAVLMAWAPEMYALLKDTEIGQRIKADIERVTKLSEYGKRCQVLGAVGTEQGQKG